MKFPRRGGPPQTDGDADDTQNRSDQRGGRVLLRDQIHDDHDDQPERNPVGQNRDRRGQAGQRETERCTASTRGRRELAAEKVEEAGSDSSIDRAPRAAHGRYRGSTDAKGIIRIVHFDAYREARGEADPVKRALARAAGH